MTIRRARLAIAVLGLLAASAAGATGRGPYAAAVALDADLLARESATATLGRWCEALRPAGAATVRAVRAGDTDAAAPADLRRRLGAGAAEPVRFRHVRLVCGGRVLSDARNWYLPGRLTPAMNRALDTTGTPFGVVVAPLAFHRLRLGSLLLVAPGQARAPPFILEQRAVLISAAGLPFAYVDERYSRALIAAAPR